MYIILQALLVLESNMQLNTNEYNPSSKGLNEAYIYSVLDVEDDEDLCDLSPELLGIDGLIFETKERYET